MPDPRPSENAPAASLPAATATTPCTRR
jgi:hypothetical protein